MEPIVKQKRQKKPPESVSGLYVALPIAILDSVAFTGASHPAKALLLEAMRQHNGKNNGHLQLSASWLSKRGWNSRDVTQRAKKELIERRLLIETRQGGRNMGASLYAVTWLPITNYFGLDIDKKNYSQGAWAFMDNLPIGQNRKISTV